MGPMRATWMLLVFVIPSAAACGAPTTPPAPTSQQEYETPLKDTTAERCFATANVERKKKENEPQKISAKHVLVKFSGAKRADAGVKRTRAQACIRALEARDKLVGGADFSEIVKEYSEEPGAASREGSIGAVERADVAPPFADAAFELDVNQVSEVVETEFGFHIIMRTE
jgi:parvulin-like peptidyl-prolyl isomerase